MANELSAASLHCACIGSATTLGERGSLLMRPPRPRILWGRRTFLVDPAFQLKSSLILGGAGLAAGLACAATMHLVRIRLLADLSLPPALVAELSSRNLPLFLLVAATPVACGGLLPLLWGFFTPKISRPVFPLTPSP